MYGERGVGENLAPEHKLFDGVDYERQQEESIWLSHEELLALFADSHDVQIDPDASKIIETQFLEPVDMNDRRPVIARFKPSELITLEQVRQQYDINRIRRVGADIATSGQLQNCGVAYLDPEHAAEYLEAANRFFGTTYSLADFKSDDYGNYPIVMFGHNRIFGIALNNLEENEHIDVGTSVLVNMYPNTSFDFAICSQLTENTGVPPPLYHRAYSIRAYAEFAAAHGSTLPIEEIAANVGCTIGQVQDAFVYTTLPAGLRDLVERQEGGLSFSSALYFASLSGISSEEEMVTYASQAMQRGYSGKRIRKMVQEISGVAGLPDEVRMLLHSGALDFESASELRLLSGVIEGQEIANMAMACYLNSWSHQEMRAKVIERFNNANVYQAGLFGNEIDGLEDAQMSADQRFWRKQYDAIVKKLQESLSAVNVYLTMQAQSAGGSGALHSAIPEARIQAWLQLCAESIGRLETFEMANSPDQLREMYQEVKLQIDGRLRSPVDSSAAPEPALF